jgi:hypothetical protein
VIAAYPSEGVVRHQIRRLVLSVDLVAAGAVLAAQVGGRIQPDRLSPVWLWLEDCPRDCRRPRS